MLPVSSIIRLSVEILFLSLPSRTQSLGILPVVKPCEGPKISKYPSGLTLATDSEQLEIIGRKKLLGSIPISGSKNATLPILAATILSDKKILIKNIPIVRDVETMVDLLSTIGSSVKLNKKKKKI